MGLTPLAGIMMGTRSGELDPSVVDFMVNNIGLPASQISSTLNKQSGLLGVSGVSSDFRDVEAGANEGNERCQLALDIYYQKVADFIAQYYVALGHVDAIAFTAGIGENSALARGKILELVAEATGIVVDEEANKKARGEALISAPESQIKVFVIPTNEELMIFRDTKRLLGL